MIGLQQGKTPYGMVGAVVIGNALDWYDFTLYGYFAVIIARLFFPAESSWTSLLSAFAVSGVAFIVRPFGGIYLAQRADRLGRRSVLIFVIGLMTVGTAMMAAAPSYATIGVAAPIIIVISRLLQGFSAGGEFASATAFLVEHAPPERRGLYGAWQFSGQGMAILLSGVAGWLGAELLGPVQFAAWGWRVPFVLGLVIGPVGYYLRLKLHDAPALTASLQQMHQGPAPVREVIVRYKRRILIGLGLVIGGSAALYVLFVFMPTYAIRVLGMTPQAAFVAPISAGLTLAIFCPVMGRISDAIGHKPVLIVSTAGLLLASYPAFWLLQQEPTVVRLALVEFGFGLLFSIGAGPFSAALAAMFPMSMRATGMAIAYNVGVALFGGLAPFIVAWLISVTANPLSPAYYVALCVVAAVVAAFALPTRSE